MNTKLNNNELTEPQAADQENDQKISRKKPPSKLRLKSAVTT